MRTDDLIGMLAAGAGPVAPPRDTRRLVLGLPLALAAAAAAVWAGLGFLPTADWAASATVPKITYAALLAGSGLWLLRRIGRPGHSGAAPLALALAVLGGVLGLGLADLAATEAAARGARLLGHSARECPLLILGLSLPALAATMVAARALAPVRLRLAGAAAGLAAGGLAATAYALACTEGAAAFVAAWYTLGMLLAAGLGALLGPRVLRW